MNGQYTIPKELDPVLWEHGITDKDIMRGKIRDITGLLIKIWVTLFIVGFLGLIITSWKMGIAQWFIGLLLTLLIPLALFLFYALLSLIWSDDKDWKEVD